MADFMRLVQTVAAYRAFADEFADYAGQYEDNEMPDLLAEVAEKAKALLPPPLPNFAIK